jgi:competence protein ComEA
MLLAVSASFPFGMPNIKEFIMFKSIRLSLLLLALVSLPLSSTYAKPSKGNSAQSKEGRKVNINEAGVKLLKSLTGIGVKKAQKIIENRKANGLFQTVDELTRVKGIGKGTVEKNRHRMTVGTVKKGKKVQRQRIRVKSKSRPDKSPKNAKAKKKNVKSKKSK